MSAQIEAFPVAGMAPQSADPAMLGTSSHQRREGDFYATPEWVTEVLCRHVKFDKVWEPACGEGDMSRVLWRSGASVVSTDLHNRDYGVSHGVNFLDIPVGGDRHVEGDIVTNPPYSIADEFVEHALELAEPNGRKVAMLMRQEWDCASSRFHLFGQNSHFAMKIVLTKRPRWIEGSTGSPRHSYSWYIWDFGMPSGLPVIIYDQ